MTGRLSTCSRCRGTIRYDGAGGYDHTAVTERTTGHVADPDDGAVSGPDADDLGEEQ